MEGSFSGGRSDPGSRNGSDQKDFEIQDEYGGKYRRSWYNEAKGEAFRLCEAPTQEAPEAVYRETHGLVADETTEVKESS
jgi:hypothetical protein